MEFRSILLRSGAVLALAALLSSCGGESLVAFVPSRILSFGDQSSVITTEAVPARGRKYTINAVNEDGTINCTANPIWNQVLATAYGRGFPQCPSSLEASAPVSRILAKPGATAGGSGPDDLTEQITRQLALPAADGGGIGDGDLVSVLIGVNDVVAAYERFEAGASAAEATAQAEAAGTAIALQVNRIAALGGKVIMATVPDVSLTPFGRSKGAEGMILLSALTARVNAKLLVNLNNNGRQIGLIELNPYLLNVVAYPSAYGYDNAVDAACIPPDVLNCTTLTLRKGIDGVDAGPFSWLWADALQLSPGGHQQLGNLAASRAQNQPF